MNQNLHQEQGQRADRSCLACLAYHFCDVGAPSTARITPGNMAEARPAQQAWGSAQAQQAQQGGGVHVELLKPAYLPPAVYGIPPHALSPSLKALRNRIVYACVLEAVFCLLSVPLGAVRGGIGRMNAGINLVLFFCSLVGLNGALRFNKIHVLLHWLLVSGLVGAFALFVSLSVLFGSSTASGNWIIVVVYIFLCVDLAIAWESRRFQIALSGLQAEQAAAGMLGGGVGGGGQGQQGGAARGGGGGAAGGADGQRLFGNSHGGGTGGGRGGGGGVAQPTIAALGREELAIAVAQPVVSQQQREQRQHEQQQAQLPAAILADAADVPDEFLCPITREVMNEPVVCADGHTYERDSIREWFRSHRTSPKTNTVLPHKQLVPNHALRSQIGDMADRHRARKQLAAAARTAADEELSQQQLEQGDLGDGAAGKEQAV